MDRLYAAKTIKEAHLCKVALRALVEADIEGSAFAEQAEEPIPTRSRNRHQSMWPYKANGRRLRARAAACTPVSPGPVEEVCPKTAKQLGRMYVRRSLRQ